MGVLEDLFHIATSFLYIMTSIDCFLVDLLVIQLGFSSSKRFPILRCPATVGRDSPNVGRDSGLPERTTPEKYAEPSFQRIGGSQQR